MLYDYLVGGFNSLKYMKVSWDYYSQYMESHKIPWFQSPPSRIYFDDIGMPRLYHHKEWEIPLNIGSSPSTTLWTFKQQLVLVLGPIKQANVPLYCLYPYHWLLLPRS